MISIVITSYNYERFLRAAIDSALGQSFPCEVIVVDDGSTDRSVDIIKSYGDRIKPVFKSNGGEASAMWEGLKQASHDTVIFLDSDDVLYPCCAATVIPYLAADVAKIQFRLDKIDADGRNKFRPFPRFSRNMSSDHVLQMVLRTGHYPSPVNTGIAYNRTYLEKVLPIEDSRFRDNADGYLTVLAPLYGKVVSLDSILGAYRVHSNNFWTNDMRLDRYGMYVAHELARQDILVRHAERLGLQSSLDAVFRNKAHVEHRILSLRLNPKDHPVVGDRRSALFWNYIYFNFLSRHSLALSHGLWFVYIVLICWLPSALLPSFIHTIRNSQRRARWTHVVISRSCRLPGAKISKKLAAN